MATKRLFVAVELTDSVKDTLHRIQQRLQPYFVRATWARPEGLHITLKFLGPTPVERIDAIVAALTPVARQTQPFTMEVRGIGVFPGWDRPRVLWVGVTDARPLVALQARVETALSAMGFSPERRTYHPHVTLARIRWTERGVIRQFRERMLHQFDRPWGTTVVRAFVLFESQLHPQGAIYTPLHRFRFAL